MAKKRDVVKEIRRATRRKFSVEEKIRIVPEGLRGEIPVAELCRREGIAPTVYYKWSKAFLDAGKNGLTRDTQRGGPSTGLPAKTEQADLNMAMFGGTGDSPRIVIAPTTVAECYDCTAPAFYLAEKYQMPVILLMDFFLSRSIKNIDTPEPPDEKMLAANASPSESALKDYKRYRKLQAARLAEDPRPIVGTLYHDKKRLSYHDYLEKSLREYKDTNGVNKYHTGIRRGDPWVAQGGASPAPTGMSNIFRSH